MPQMSPIGWLWIIFFTVFGYLFFLALFYYFSLFLSILLELSLSN